VYNAANSQQSNTYQYPTDKKVRKLFEVPSYFLHILAESEEIKRYKGGSTKNYE